MTFACTCTYMYMSRKLMVLLQSACIVDTVHGHGYDGQQKYCIAGNMVGIKFGGWVPNSHCKNIGGFKFGSLVRDRHTRISK